MNEVINPIQHVDVDLSATGKQTFMIKLKENDIRPLELNPSDLLFIKRLNDIYPRLKADAEVAVSRMSIDENKSAEEILAESASALTDIDNSMRIAMDELFDTNVSEVCAPQGSMYDPINGEFRFEYIINALSALYEKNIREEMEKTSKKLKKHTGKYVNK